MRRILQATGCEVIHLGHNRSVEEIVDCALQEDAHGIAISSYQGGHVEFFKYMLDLLRERGGGHIKVFGGGGGVIVPSEIQELHDYGVTRIFSPEDGQKLGLQGMINEIVAACDVDLDADGSRLDCAARRRRPLRADQGARAHDQRARGGCRAGGVPRGIARGGGAKQDARCSASPAPAARARARSPTSWCAASAWTSDDRLKIAILSIDPSRRKSGGALLGDRIRMNAIHAPNIYMRSLATRDAGSEISQGAARRHRRVQGGRASTSSSSRRRASARATRRSCRTSTSRCT